MTFNARFSLPGSFSSPSPSTWHPLGSSNSAAGLQEMFCFSKSTGSSELFSSSLFLSQDKDYFLTLEFYLVLPQSIVEIRIPSTPGW